MQPGLPVQAPGIVRARANHEGPGRLVYRVHKVRGPFVVGIPGSKSSMPTPRTQRLKSLDAVLADAIRGQAHALPRIASALKRGELGLSKPSRPRSSFLLLGPTGVGKTETVVVATRHLFGERTSLFRFDMSEFQTQESLGLLLGARLGEQGYLGMVSERAKEGSLLFDEVEKAHPRVLDVLLQLLDAARVTVATGTVLDFAGFHVWLTSNVGAADLLGVQHSSEATLERHVLTKAQQTFRPEIFARIAEKIVFHRLGFEVQLEIARGQLEREVEFLATQGYRIEVESAVLPFLVRKGFHPRLGARPMRDTIERLVGDAVAERVLEGPWERGVLCVQEVSDRLAVRATGGKPDGSHPAAAA